MATRTLKKKISTGQHSKRQIHERRPSDRAKRWKIPAITPIGADAPVSKTLPLAVKRIAQTLHPEKIILFGSYAYGNPTPDSDVDLLVIMPSEAEETERYLQISRLLRPRPFAVDILVKTPQEISTSLEKGDFFIDEIVSQGKILYKRPDQSV
jgi:predicted nucleotidyltransferase